jgi:hypothetical protein
MVIGHCGGRAVKTSSELSAEPLEEFGACKHTQPADRTYSASPSPAPLMRGRLAIGPELSVLFSASTTAAWPAPAQPLDAHVRSVTAFAVAVATCGASVLGDTTTRRVPARPADQASRATADDREPRRGDNGDVCHCSSAAPLSRRLGCELLGGGDVSSACDCTPASAHVAAGALTCPVRRDALAIAYRCMFT